MLTNTIGGVKIVLQKKSTVLQLMGLNIINQVNGVTINGFNIRLFDILT